MRVDGTLLLELEFVEPYPWLGTLSISFVEDPAISFEIELAAANLTDLIPVRTCNIYIYIYIHIYIYVCVCVCVCVCV